MEEVNILVGVMMVRVKSKLVARVMVKVESKWETEREAQSNRNLEALIHVKIGKRNLCEVDLT